MIMRAAPFCVLALKCAPEKGQSMQYEDVEKLLLSGYADRRKEYQSVLRNITPLKDYSAGRTIPLAGIEEVLAKMVRKYDIRLQWVSIMTNKDGLFSYSLSIVQQSKNEWITTVYDEQIYGLFAKVLLTCFILVKSGKVGRRRK